MPGGPVKNLPSKAGDVSSVPGQGPKIPHTAEQQSVCHSGSSRTAMKDAACYN